MPEDTDNNSFETERFPRDPARVRAFADFFKRYMSISSVVAAALPIPVTAISLIPTYAAHTKLLSTYTPMICFLILGYIFYMRQKIGNRLFGFTVNQYNRIKFNQDPHGPLSKNPEDAERFFSAMAAKARRRRLIVDFIPFLLISLSLTFILFYHYTLDRSLTRAMADQNIQNKVYREVEQKQRKAYVEWQRAVLEWAAQNKVAVPRGEEIQASPFIDSLPPELQIIPEEEEIESDPDKFLKLTPLSLVPKSLLLILCYIMFFAFAEAAFIFMAVKEYIQDLLKLSDIGLLVNDERAAYNEVELALHEASYRRKKQMEKLLKG